MWAIQSLKPLKFSLLNKDKIELDIKYDDNKVMMNYSFFLENFSVKQLKKVKKLSLSVFYKGNQFKEINIFLTKTGFREIDSNNSYFDYPDYFKEKFIKALSCEIRTIFISPWSKSLLLPNEIIFDFWDDIEEAFLYHFPFLIKDWEVFDMIENKKRYWFSGTYRMVYWYDNNLYEDENFFPVIEVDKNTYLLIWETNLIECNYLSDSCRNLSLYSESINKIIKIIKERHEFKFCTFDIKQWYMSFVLDKDFSNQFENINKLFVDKSTKKTIFENKFKNLILFISYSKDKLELEIKIPKEIYCLLDNNWFILEWENFYDIKFINNKDTNYSLQFKRLLNSNRKKAKLSVNIEYNFFYQDVWNKRTFLRKKYTWGMTTFLTLENIISTYLLRYNENVSIFLSISSDWIFYIFDSDWNIKKEFDLNVKIPFFRESQTNKDNLRCWNFYTNDFEILLKISIPHSDNNFYLLSINQNFESNVYEIANIFKFNNIHKETSNFTINQNWKSCHFKCYDHTDILIKSKNMPHIKNFSKFKKLDIKRLLWRLNSIGRKWSIILNYWIHWLHDIKKTLKNEKWVDEINQATLSYLDTKRLSLVWYLENIFNNDFFWRETFDFYLESFVERFSRDKYKNVFKNHNYYFIRQNNLKLWYVVSIIQTQ